VEDNFRYMIYRVYSKSERPDYASRSIFYGWTRSKDVKKAFLSQRNKDKYRCVKAYDEDISEEYSEDVLDRDTMIDYINLRFASNPQNQIPFFTTVVELKAAEKNIQKYFKDLCSLDSVRNTDNIITMLTHLDPYYSDALEYIGFRPEILEAMFPRACAMEGQLEIDRIENWIDMAYDGSYTYPEEEASSKHNIPGIGAMEDVSNKILYSVESFVKILRDEL